jgi:WD40 repeat protein
MCNIIVRSIVVLLWLATLPGINAAAAGEPNAPPAPPELTTEPILRIDPGDHTAIINGIATDRAGRWLVTASSDKTARVWSLVDGRLATILRVPIGDADEGKLYAVALSPDGTTVAVAGWTGLSYDDAVSIFIFDRASGRLLRRLKGLSNVVDHLAYSPDGRILAAALGNDGLRLFDAADGRLLAEDHDYGSDSYSVHFDPSAKNGARLVTTCADGFLRLYRFGREGLVLSARQAAPGGQRPYAARFSPDGRRIAVGFSDSSSVNVLDGHDLRFLHAPDNTGASDSLSRIAWSRDGAWLYAAGRAARPHALGQNYIRRWPMTSTGAGASVDWPAAPNTLTDLAPLAGGRLVFASGDPVWGVVDAAGKKTLFHGPSVANFGDDQTGFKLSADGSQVRFSYAGFGRDPAVFKLLGRSLLPTDSGDLAPLQAPDFEGPAQVVSDWENTAEPKLNGRILPLDEYEVSRSLAFRPDGRGFVLGTDWSLRAFDQHGQAQWRQSSPGAVWALNISRDGRWIVAAYSDGTIRWHGAADGEERLALYPHPDKKRWVLWTTSGYYDASPGGEDLIGWHLNQGKDSEARFVPNNQLYDVFFRPDIVQATFRGEDVSGLITITAAEALKNPPPMLRFSKLPSPGKRHKATICYEATSAGGGIGEVRLFQNGKLVKSDGFYREASASRSGASMTLAALDGPAIQRSLRLLAVAQAAASPSAASSKGSQFAECHQLETMPGENEISVAAFNASNTVQSRLETARFRGDRKAPEPHLYVLGIGIDRYRDPAATLEHAVKDSSDFLSMIKRQARSLFKPQNIHLAGLSDGAATKDGIQKAIRRLAGKVKPWDSFIFFVASHGVLLENQYFIVTAGFSGSINRAELISSNEIVAMSTHIKALSQLLIFDTCHAGGVDSFIGGLYDARMSVMARKMGLHVYASAGSTQAALDGYRGNGLFTHSLLKGMAEARATDSNRDGQVSVVELGQRARQETIDISRQLGYPQSPNIINFGRDNALFRMVVKETTGVHYP